MGGEGFPCCPFKALRKGWGREEKTGWKKVWPYPGGQRTAKKGASCKPFIGDFGLRAGAGTACPVDGGGL